MTRREMLAEQGYEDVVVFENPDYDSAIIGVTNTNQVVYDYDKMLENLMKTDNMSAEDAADFISYNTIRGCSYFGEGAPVVMFRLEE